MKKDIATKRITLLQNISFITFIMLLALILRIFLFPIESGDYNSFLKDWCQTLRDNGGFKAIGLEIGDYMPPYFYILAFLTYLPGSDLMWIKIISCAADFLLGFYVMRIVNLKFSNKLYGLFAYIAVLYLPNVFLNSAGWAQCDAIYTTALLASLYSLLKNHKFRAILAFSIAFVFKIQAIFFAPVLFLLLLKGKIKIRHLLVFPGVYLIAILPATIMGRNFFDLLCVYIEQSKIYSSLCLSIPNLYSFIRNAHNDYIGRAGIFFAGGVVLTLIFILVRKSFVFNKDIMIKITYCFAILLPFILPHMHERYYYFADIMSVIFAFYNPKKLYAPIILCVSSLISIVSILVGITYFPIELLSIANLIALILVIRDLWKSVCENPEIKQPEITPEDSAESSEVPEDSTHEITETVSVAK